MAKALDYTIAPEDRVPIVRKLLYAMAVFPEPLFLGTVGNFIVLYYNSKLGVSATLIGFILFVPRAWDAITDPLIGKWSDGCKSKWGRRRPFILWGGITTVITYILLWLPPPQLTTENGKAIYLLITGVLFFTAYTVFSIPYGALAIELSPDYKERTSIMSIRKFIHAGGEMLILTMPTIGAFLSIRLFGLAEESPRYTFATAAILFAAVSTGFILLAFFGTKEREAKEMASEMPFMQAMLTTLKNPLFVRLCLAVVILVCSIMVLASYINYLFLYYMNAGKLMAIYGLYSGILGMPLAFVWWAIGNRIGKSASIFYAQLIICIACLSTFVCFNPDMPYLVFITATLYGFGWSGVLVMAPNIMADITDLDELETGQRREGSYGGVYGFLFKFAVAAASPLLGFGVDWSGFDPELGVNQTAQTFMNLRLITSIGSAFFAFLALLLVWRFPLTPERVIEIRRILEERRGKRGAIQ